MRSLAWGFILPGLPLLAIMAGLDHGAEDSLTGVESKRFSTRDFRLESGAVLPEVKIAYETYGQLAGNGCNTVLMTHGYTSDHHAAGRRATGDKAPGWWDSLIVPSKPIDTYPS